MECVSDVFLARGHFDCVRCGYKWPDPTLLDPCTNASYSVGNLSAGASNDAASVLIQERYVAEDVLHIADGEFVFRISDPKIGTLQGPLLEISTSGALITTKHQFDAAAYETVLDVTIELKGQLSRQFFASVSGTEATGVRLAWLNIDPGQQGRLKILLDAYRARYGQKSVAPAAEGPHKTRRLVKPSAPPSTPAPIRQVSPMIITPFGADPTPSSSPILADTAAKSESPSGEHDAAERIGTRRVLKPAAQTISVFGEEAGGPSEDSKAHRVVIAPTARFEKLASETHSSEDEADVSAAADAGKTVVGQDGRMDISATLRSKGKMIRASELAARHDKVRVLNLATIRQLIQEVVEEAAGHMTRAMNEAERKRLLEEAEEGFQERMKAFQLEKINADEKSKQLADQLGKAQKLLEDERKRSISADQFTVSTAGLVEIEGAFQKVIDRCVVNGQLTPDLEEQLRKLTAHVLDAERKLVSEKEAQAQNDKIELLEKKIKRLAGNLEDTERQRDEAREIATALENSAGMGLSLEQIKQKYQIGLSKDDPRREQKLMVMRELLEQNRELRKKLGIATNAEDAAVADKKAKAIAENVNAAAAAIMPNNTPSGGSATVSDNDAPTDGEPMANPDDEVWSPDPEPQASPTLKRYGAEAESEADEQPAEPAVNPDDLPWDPPAAVALPDGEDDRGVKVMRDFKKFEPPPLHKK